MNRKTTLELILLILKILLTAILIISSLLVGMVGLILAFMSITASQVILSVAAILLLPSILPFLWVRKKKKYLLGWTCGILAVGIAFAVPFSIEKYEESITINVTPNINVEEYLPFTEDSKIVKLDSKTTARMDTVGIDGTVHILPSAVAQNLELSSIRLQLLGIGRNSTPRHV